MNRAFQKDQPFKQQADMLASKGRYGDSMLVHMNPREVDVLRSMTPNNALTINPDTGQPEAFLPLLLALGGGLLGATAPIGALGVLGGATGLAAIGSGLGTAIETGSFEEGLKAGLISGVLGGIGGKFLGEGLQGGQELIKEGTKQTTEQVVQQGGSELFKTGGGEVFKEVANVGGGEILSNIATQSPLGFSPAAAPTLQKVGEAVVNKPITDAATQNIFQKIGGSLAEITPTQLGSIGTAALTGQGMTDQYLAMNMPLGMADDDEDFYVPVTLDDRGVQFPVSGRGGRSSEMDYFANPFSYTQQFQQGGPVDFGGFDPNAPFVGMAGPQFFTNAPEVIGTETVQQYVPRSEDTQFNLGTRGFEDAPVIDYSARLLGDPTLTRNIYGTTTTDDSGSTTGTTTGTTTGSTTDTSDPTDAITDPNQDPGGAPGSDYEGGNVTGDPTAPGQTPGEPGMIIPGYQDPTGMGFNPDDFIAASDIDSYIADYLVSNPIDTSSFVTQDDIDTTLQGFDPLAGFDPTGFVTQDDLSTTLQGFDPMAGLNTSDFLTADDLNTALLDFNPQIDTSQFVTATDFNTALTGFNPGIDTSNFVTQADLNAMAFDPTGLQSQIDTLSAAPAATAFDPTGLQTQIDALNTQLANVSRPSAGLAQAAGTALTRPTNVAMMPMGRFS